MKELLNKAYNNNYIFYSLGAFTSFLLFFFTFKNLHDFMSRQFIEAFSLFLFMSFVTAMILELKSAFFGEKSEEVEYVEAEEELNGIEVEERAKLSDSKEKNISNSRASEVVYEWDEVEEQEVEETTESKEKVEEEYVEKAEKGQKKEEVKPKIQKKKISPQLEEEDNTPPEAAGFVPDNQDDPFS